MPTWKEIKNGLSAQTRSDSDKLAIDAINNDLNSSKANEQDMTLDEIIASKTPEHTPNIELSHVQHDDSYDNKASLRISDEDSEEEKNRKVERYLTLQRKWYEAHHLGEPFLSSEFWDDYTMNKWKEAFAEMGEDVAYESTEADAYSIHLVQKIAEQASPYYKKYKNTSKLPEKDLNWEELTREFDFIQKEYNTDVAIEQLNTRFRNIVADNQPWYEQAENAFLGIGASAGGALASFAGGIVGAADFGISEVFNDGASVLGIRDTSDNENLNFWDKALDSIIDNSITRYGDDVVTYQDFLPSDIKEDKEIGLARHEVAQSEDQEKQLISVATPWVALQQGGFTLASMLTGWGEAKLAGWAFKGMKAVRAGKTINMARQGTATAQDLMKAHKALAAIQKAEKKVNTFVIPGLTGTSEGLIEGLNTKEEIEEEGKKILDAQVDRIVTGIVKSVTDAPGVTMSRDRKTGQITYKDAQGNVIDMHTLYNEAYQYAINTDEYLDSKAQIEYAASKAGINNFYMNSAINGITYSTLKAGLTAPSVQTALKDSRVFGWAFSKPRLSTTGTPGTESATVTVAKRSLGNRMRSYGKEVAGEFVEEYIQTVTDKTAQGGAIHNIKSFIDNKYNGDGTAAVGDYMAGDIGAAWTALTESVVSKEAVQSGILGAVSSVMGTPTRIRRSSSGTWLKGQREDGSQESTWDVVQRLTPWRSGLTSVRNEQKREDLALRNEAEALTEWLRDPNNKDKFDGLTGTMNWAKAMNEAAMANDEFGYRNSKLGKTINDIIMLQKLKGTAFYNSIMNTLSKTANLEERSADADRLIQEIRNDKENSFDESTSDSEIIKQLKDNANKMLTTMDQIQQKSEEIDKMLGYVNNDTKQSLIFGELMIDDWTKRAKMLDDEISHIQVTSSRDRASSLTKEQRAVLSKYGSIANAQKRFYQLQEEKSKLAQDIDNINKRKNISEEDKENRDQKKKAIKAIDKELKDIDKLSSIENESETILNEEDIMALDPISRAIMLFKGKERTYTVTHSGTQEYNQMLQDLATKQARRQKWIGENGKVKKGHNKQVQKIDKEIADLKHRIQNATAETRDYYSPEQQQVIDNLYNELYATDKTLFDKLIDRGRIEQAMSKMLTDYNDILMDRDAFNVYAYRAKESARKAAVAGRFEALNAIDDYQTFAEEMDKVYDSASEADQRTITAAMKRHNNANFSRYSKERHLLSDLFRQISTDDAFKDLDSNDQDLFAYTLQYLTNKGIDMQDENAVVEALSQRNEDGTFELQRYIDNANSVLPETQRTQFTSVGEMINTFQQVMRNYVRDNAEKKKNSQPITPSPTSQAQSAPAAPVNPTPKPASPASAPGIFGQAATSLEEADEDARKTNEQKEKATSSKQESSSNQKSSSTQESATTDNSVIEASTPIQKAVALARNIINNASDSYSSETKNKALAELTSIPTDVETSPQEYAEAMMATANRLDANSEDDINEKAAALLRQAAAKVQNIAEDESGEKSSTEANDSRKIEARDKTQSIFDTLRERAEQRANGASGRNLTNAAIMRTSSFDWLKKHHPDNPIVKYWDAHHVEEFLRNNGIKDRKNTPVYFISDSTLATEIKQSIESSGGVYTKEDIPVIAVVEHPSGDIHIGGKNYQVIGTFPSSTPRSFNVLNQDGTIGRLGISNIQRIRNLVNPNNPDSFIQDANGNIVTTTIATINATVPQHISASDPNENVVDLSLQELDTQKQQELEGLSKQELRERPEYKSLKHKFLSMLQYVSGKNYVEYMMPNLKDGSIAVPVFVRRIANTEDRNSGRLITELFNTNDVEALLNSNSRLEKAADVLAKLAETLSHISDFSDETLSEISDKLTKDMTRQLSFSAGDNWKYTLTATDEVTEDGHLQYQLTLKNSDSGESIPLGTVISGSMSIQTQFDILKNLIMNDDGTVRKNEISDFVKWNVDYPNSKQTIKDVESGLARAFDDGIFEISHTALTYTINSVSINSPFTSNGELRVAPSVANDDNANTNPQNPTNIATNATRKGNAVIDTDTGTVVQGSAPTTENKKLAEAKKIVSKIEEDAQHIKLTADEKSYSDDRTGDRFARVTSIIAADAESDGRFDSDSGWAMPSTNIGTSVDEFVRDFFSGKFFSKDGSLNKDFKYTYPNASHEQWQAFAAQLIKFKNSLDAQGITIIPRDVIASGILEVTDKEGNKHTINVAGTVDLLGYDQDGNFIIFDMKTVRNRNIDKHKKAKWKRQLSLYQKFLHDKYGITVKETRVIPIHVDYPAPAGEKSKGSFGTANYSIKQDSRQLFLDDKLFLDSHPTLLPILNNIGYKDANIRYENLTEDEKELIANLEKAFEEGDGVDNPQDIEIQSAEPVTPAEPAIDSDFGIPIEDADNGLFDASGLDRDSHTDNTSDNDEEASTSRKFTPSRLAWNSFRDFKNENGVPINVAQTMESLKQFYTEETWNEMTDQEQEHELRCKGVFG